ncbi:MAG: hypothetical protein KDC49_10385 [Saprospiraceae bacterium]|nr:hypothetical protein [Saprospiraceae bacterium]
MPPSKNKLDKQVLIYDEFPKLDVQVASPTKLMNNKPTQVDSKLEAKWAKDMFKDVDLKKVKTTLTLSAAQTTISGKAHLEAVACRNVFPTNPTIEFHNDRSDHFGGQLYFWLHGLKGGEQMQFIIQMTGYASGGAKIRVGASYPTLYSLVPIEVQGSMNLTLGNVLQVASQPTGGLGLVTLEVNFNNAQYGSWLFWDIKFKNLNE